MNCENKTKEQTENKGRPGQGNMQDKNTDYDMYRTTHKTKDNGYG